MRAEGLSDFLAQPAQREKQRRQAQSRRDISEHRAAHLAETTVFDKLTYKKNQKRGNEHKGSHAEKFVGKLHFVPLSAEHIGQAGHAVDNRAEARQRGEPHSELKAGARCAVHLFPALEARTEGKTDDENKQRREHVRKRYTAVTAVDKVRVARYNLPAGRTVPVQSRDCLERVAEHGKQHGTHHNENANSPHSVD